MASAFVAAGAFQGIAMVPAPREGSPESAPGPVVYRQIPDPGAFRDICLTWSADRRMLPDAELFRRHAIRRAAAGKLPEVQDDQKP